MCVAPPSGQSFRPAKRSVWGTPEREGTLGERFSDAEWYDGNVCDRCTAGCASRPEGLATMAAGMHCVTVTTPLLSSPHWTHSLSVKRCKLCVINLIFMSNAEKESEATCCARYHATFECSVICSSTPAVSKLVHKGPTWQQHTRPDWNKNLQPHGRLWNSLDTPDLY